jgi:hypothetical protein
MVQVDLRQRSQWHVSRILLHAGDLTEDDATMQERFTVPRAALELGNETAAITALSPSRRSA